ncbi:MAG: hypothetical protein DRJ05_01760 [Bacteroidetes bacterium]|nr:MAG: hypothetical protein DRJ05_01760 [Bacteroidota bacterium]
MIIQNPKKIIILAISLFFYIAPVSSQMLISSPKNTMIHVPGDQPTIQAGIDAAITGDTVLVASGTYYENIDFNGKNIVVASHYALAKDLGFIGSTIINGSEALNADTASCVRIVSGEGPTAVLQGFTIKGGTGTHWVDPQSPNYIWHSGGGVFTFQSSPTIKNNYLIHNHCDGNTGADGSSGGGICLFGGSPLVINNVIKYNTAQYGAGVVIDYANCELKNNIVAQNSCGNLFGGGGIWAIGDGTETIIIENNTIVDNESETRGGAMFIWTAQLITRNNIIWGNTQYYDNQIFLYSGGVVELEYTDIEGDIFGIGLIDVIPEFADTTYILASGSPCIDVGNPEEIYNDIEVQENTGQALWPSQGQLRNDMGAYGGPLACALYDFTTGIINMPIKFQEISVEVYPNPFYGKANIEVTSPDYNEEIRLLLYDIYGNPIDVKFEGKMSDHKKNFRLININKGTYVLKIISRNSIVHKKILSL